MSKNICWICGNLATLYYKFEINGELPRNEPGYQTRYQTRGYIPSPKLMPKAIEWFARCAEHITIFDRITEEEYEVWKVCES